MSGHSKWSTIKREKGAKDAKRGAIFTKIGNQIAIAARSGLDPTMNSALAMAIEKAKQANMPQANIQRAIDRVADKNAAVLEEVTYEGMGPGGVGIIIETATDNKNRTFPDVRNALSKNGGRIADAHFADGDHLGAARRDLVGDAVRPSLERAFERAFVHRRAAS